MVILKSTVTLSR